MAASEQIVSKEGEILPQKWEIGQIALCKSLLCTIEDIYKSEIGINVFAIKYADSQDREVVQKHQLSPFELDGEVTLEEDQFRVLANLSTNAGVSASDNIDAIKHYNRYLDLSESEIDDIAKARLSTSTEYQTRWSVKLFKGMYEKVVKNSIKKLYKL